MRRRRSSGQATIEYVIVLGGVIIPFVFGLIYLAQMLWIWHGVGEFSRAGAAYAATHCWQASAGNVTSYMQTHVPAMIDEAQFQTGAVTIQVNYFAKDPTTGQLTDFSCDVECSTECIPDVVVVHVNNYQFRNFVQYLGIAPVTMPDFVTTAAMESAGCDPEQGACLP
jgi:hypothetical protein